MNTLFLLIRSLCSPRTLGLLTAVLLVSSIFIPEAHATGEAITSLTKILAPIGDGAGQALAIASVYITIGVVYISTIFAILLGDLMDSTYIMGSGMGDTLHMMWTVVRNFVNIGFIIILLVMAIMVILGIGQEGGTGMLKKSLPAFIIALVAVNFTFFGARLVLTASDVLSSAIFTIPSSVSMTTNVNLRIPCSSEYKNLDDCMTAVSAEASATLKGTDAALMTRMTKQVKQWFEYMDYSQTTQFLQKGFDKKTGIFAMLTHMLSMTNLLEVSATGGVANAGGTGGDLFVNGLFSIVISIATGIVIFALAMGMIVRVAILWITIAISPLIALGYVLKEMFQFEAGSDFDPMKEFLTHAFLPVFVAIPLSIGFTMILTGHALTLQGKGLNSALESTNAFNNIIWWIASLLVIWFGTFKAAAKSEYVSAVTEKIKGGAEGMFGAVAGTLKYMPIIPGIGGASGTSISAITQTPGIMASKIQGAARERQNQMANNALSALPDSWHKVPKSVETLTQDMRGAADNMRNGTDEEALKTHKGFTDGLSKNPYGAWDAAQGTTVTGINIAGFNKVVTQKLDTNTEYTLDQVLEHVAQYGKGEVRHQTERAIGVMKNDQTVAEQTGPKVPNKGDTFAGNDLYKNDTAATTTVAGLSGSADVHIYEHKEHSGDAAHAVVVDVKTGKSIGSVEEVKKEIEKLIDNAESINSEADIASAAQSIQNLKAGFLAKEKGEEDLFKMFKEISSADDKKSLYQAIDSDPAIRALLEKRVKALVGM